MIENSRVKKVVIAGGGTAGWMAAATLSCQLGKVVEICLVESDEIGTVGVGEATIPPMQAFHKLLGIDEQEFMRAVKGTFKLGISFENWGNLNETYIHSFGQTGKEFWAADFQHFWLKMRELGSTAEFGDFCLELQAAKANKFAITQNHRLNFAYHLDATLYAKFLRSYSERYGVKRIEGKIDAVNKNTRTGFIESLRLHSGELIEGDLFIDCTGFRGLLIEQTLHTGYEDWSHWLPADSAAAVQTESIGPAIPYTRSIAHEFGWQWQIPLQSRVGNGLVYCSRYLSDEDAKKTLLANISGKLINEPRIIKFRTGRRLKGWNKNCVALGLASGFIEPLESTSIHLIMSCVMRLIKLFPHTNIQEADIAEYNEQTKTEAEKIRDFIILHYHVTQRDDSPFWRHCREMEIPETLAHRIKLFSESARVFKGDNEIFRIDSWAQVMLGQGIKPKTYHPIVGMMDMKELEKSLMGFRSGIQQQVAELPTHADFIKSYCNALA
jgi:tryptophan 7-halogenase